MVALYSCLVIFYLFVIGVDSSIRFLSKILLDVFEPVNKYQIRF